ncbi:MAG: hypothetical protein M0C28_37170 [Candidatus Moduliflexus flocculans]|nr:hypothetical protein [Candidatus Moduliflexus flocculans]
MQFTDKGFLILQIHPISQLTTLADWYVGATGDKAFVPMNFNGRLSLQGKLALNVGGGKGIVLSGLYQDNEYRDYDHLYRFNPDGDYKKFQKSFSRNCKLYIIVG